MAGIARSALLQKKLFVHYETIEQLDKAYFIMFLICGGAYLLAWVIMFTLVPHMEPIQLNEKATTT